MIVTHPISETVLESATATFSCSATTNIEWIFSPLRGSDIIIEAQMIQIRNGIVESTLTLSDVNFLQNQGNYTCVVTMDGINNVTSSASWKWVK